MTSPTAVITGLDPVIHGRGRAPDGAMDARIKSGYDSGGVSALRIRTVAVELTDGGNPTWRDLYPAIAT